MCSLLLKLDMDCWLVNLNWPSSLFSSRQDRRRWFFIMNFAFYNCVKHILNSKIYIKRKINGAHVYNFTGQLRKSHDVYILTYTHIGKTWRFSAEVKCFIHRRRFSNTLINWCKIVKITIISSPTRIIVNSFREAN